MNKLCFISVLLFIQHQCFGQILYTDFNPDTFLEVAGSDSACLQVDINKDSISDFSLCAYALHVDLNPFCCTYYEIEAWAIDGNSRIGVNDSTLCSSYNIFFDTLAAMQDSGQEISNNFLWSSNSFFVFETPYYICSSSFLSSGNFLPVKLFKNGDYFFGWISMAVESYLNFSGRITLHDMAINLTPGEEIIAGISNNELTQGELSFKIYPTINNGDFEIQIPPDALNKICTFSVFSNLGMLISRIQMSPKKNTTSISLGRIGDGLYHCLISDGKNIYYSKFVVE